MLTEEQKIMLKNLKIGDKIRTVLDEEATVIEINEHDGTFSVDKVIHGDFKEIIDYKK